LGRRAADDQFLLAIGCQKPAIYPSHLNDYRIKAPAPRAAAGTRGPTILGIGALKTTFSTAKAGR
jgi:hypothetical protein